MAKYELVYFPVKGRGEHIRLLFEDNGISFKETSPMPFDKFQSEWKPKLAFGQLPALYHGDFMMVQSNAILRYLARENGLYGDSNENASKIDELNDGVEDLRSSYVKLIYQNYDDGKAEYIEKLPDNLRPFEKWLSSTNANKTGAAVGGKMSFVDYNLFDLLDMHQVLAPGCLNNFPVLKQYFEQIAARPKIQAYRATEACRTRPINGNGKQ